MKKLIALIAILALVTVAAFAENTISPATDTLEVKLSVDGQTSCGFYSTAPTFANGTAYEALAPQTIKINLDKNTLSGTAAAVVRTSSAGAFTATVTSTALAATVGSTKVIVPYRAQIGSSADLMINADETVRVGTFTVAAGTTTRQVSETFTATVTDTAIKSAVAADYTATVTLTVTPVV